MISRKKYSKIALLVKGVLAITSISVLTISSQTYAEENESEQEAERIVVTGSRIQRSSAQMTTPTTIISAQSIELSGLKNVGEILNQMPAVLDGIGGTGINDSGNGTITQAGLELANLRGLGTNRTLVLVDGRRHVAGSAGTAAVDMSMIPSELIARIEIITGGASAIYGADAVTGVINVILRKDFEGAELRVTQGQTSENDGSTSDIALTWGTGFGENNKGNITAHISYSDREEIPMTARDYSLLRPSFRSNPANTGPNDGIPDTLFFQDVRFQALSAEGLFYVPNANYAFGDTPITDLPFPTFADDPIPFGPGGTPVGYDTYTIDRDTGQFRDFIAGANCQVVPCDGGDGFRTAETNTLSAVSYT
ncbi:MAG: TonB-dependent receptor plug domain-containing protein, partial [Gammaproteobacteria bacterium]|nr:TonB-dependent receptor plug domain-containing protein [Gammaproteobacteria bacterium]